jgi:hypothetical protein
LQEFCFKTPGFGALYEEQFGGAYTLHTLQRTNRKPEGLGLLTRNAVFRTQTKAHCSVNSSFSNRIRHSRMPLVPMPAHFNLRT